MSHIIAVQEADWADEFSIFGVWIGPESQWDLIIRQTKRVHYPTESYFGTNEWLEYDSFDDWYRNIRITKVGQKTAISTAFALGNDHYDGADYTYFGQWLFPDPEVGYPEDLDE